MSATGNFVPDLLLEQYALGELSGAERATMEARLETDPSLRARLAELRVSDEAILAEAKPAEIAAAIRRRMRADTGSARGAARSGLAFKSPSAILLPAAAALLVMVGAVMGRGLLFPSASDLTRPKGGAPGLSIYKKAASGPMELVNGSPASAGDVLQIKYAAGEARYGAIYSLDGRGAITRHLPPQGAGSQPDSGEAPPLSPAGAVLGSAYELDDAPGFERFFILSSTNDFDLNVAVGALRGLAASGPLAATGAPELPAGIEWKSILLVKKAGSP